MLGAAQRDPSFRSSPQVPGFAGTALDSGHVRIMSSSVLLDLPILAPMNASSIMPETLLVND